jgi:hypothetical protein
MVATTHLDPEVLFSWLKAALRHGCRASRLARYARDLVDELFPCDERPLVMCAADAEALIRRACATYDGDWGDSLTELLGLAAGAHGAALKDRRRRAAGCLRIQPETYRRHYEDEALWDLCIALISLESRSSCFQVVK